MSTDLRQFFTTDHVPDKLEPNSYEKFFINALSYTSQKAIDDLTIAFENDETDSMIDDFGNVGLLRYHIFPDIVYLDLEQVILSAFFDKKDIEMKGFETQMEGLYDEQKEIFIEVEGIIPQLKNHFEPIYDEAKDECNDYDYDSNKSKNRVDYYNLGIINFLYTFIDFKNKSKARRFRKLYKKNYQIRAMLNGFGFQFIGGQFVRYDIVNVECESFDDYLDINYGVSNEALEIMANISKKERYNTELLQLEIERQLDEYACVTLSNHIINLLSDALLTENEVIM
ncbi:hypothetical protein [Faecalibacillus faecis]|uniref:hypothetical protein n=1 Tax=Faecalibacillus faecis TaxID=1982628 RepID=UPI003FD80238